jgi:hypothetical protein
LSFVFVSEEEKEEEEGTVPVDEERLEQIA